MRGRIILAAFLLAAFALIAVSLPPRGGTALDVVASEWLLAHETDIGTIVATWISWLGDTALAGLLVAAVAMLCFRRRWSAAVTVAIASASAPLIDVALKQLFHRGRPDHAVEFITGSTWSFPSGHSMSSLVGFGVVAYFRLERERNPHRRRLIVVATSIIIVAVAFSRLYLGVHYFSDIVGGLLAGAVWLLACIEGYHLFTGRRAVSRTDRARADRDSATGRRSRPS